ncbi:MAG TPA: S41 family peptidase [Candidatus Kapabacteria bacterium]
MFRETVLNRTMELVGEQYIFADKAEALVDLMRINVPEYAAAKTDHQFASIISRDMASITKDIHLSLSVRVKPNDYPPPVAVTSFGDHGIAILKLTRFPSAHSPKGEEAVREIDQALLRAERAKGLIIDIRKNAGGDGATVAMATSYLLPPEPKLLVVYRYRAMKPDESWTWERLPHEVRGAYRPLADKPIFVLVNKATFSAAEEFAYTLQKLGRATIVGERTKGGAHPSKRHIIDGTFVLSIPIAETISPYTHSNWEGTGVIPDVACASRDAVKIAKELMAKKLGRK